MLRCEKENLGMARAKLCSLQATEWLESSLMPPLMLLRLTEFFINSSPRTRIRVGALFWWSTFSYPLRISYFSKNAFLIRFSLVFLALLKEFQGIPSAPFSLFLCLSDAKATVVATGLCAARPCFSLLFRDSRFGRHLQYS